MGNDEEKTFKASTRIRQRMPFNWLEIYPDNDNAFINWHLLRYAEREGIRFSRSKPYKKNDNSFVEQKNSTQTRAILGHLRYDTEMQLFHYRYSVNTNVYGQRLWNSLQLIS